MFVSVSGSWRLAGVVWHVVTIVALQVVAAAKTNTLTVSKCRIILRYLQPVYWLLIALFVGENIGLQLGSIVAGLGLGSMALAMGSQEVMKDIVGPVTMLFDRPFDVDDVVVIGKNKIGRVAAIGPRSGRAARPSTAKRCSCPTGTSTRPS